MQPVPATANFDHDGCYREGLHPKTKSGRQWCRERGPASRSGRAYASRATLRNISVDSHGDTTPTDLAAIPEHRQRRVEAAERYRPERIKLLLIAEAPPAAPDRYFYFENVDTHDSLFRYVARSLLPNTEPTRENKPALLRQLRNLGVFLIDLKQDPVDGTPLDSYVPELVRRVQQLDPDRIVLIKATVYDAAYATLAAAGLPVSPVRVPFPGSGQQRAFEEAFARATQN
jgi:hypothetical protein